MFDPFYIVVGLTFVVVISILVAAHELGHYWFARLCGMEVDAFAVNVGGIRATDLSSRLPKKLVSGWVVFGALAASIVGWEVSAVAGLTPAHIAFQVLAVLVVPLWIVTRIAALYGMPLLKVLQNFAIAYAAWFGLMTMAGVVKNLGETGIVPLLSVVSIIGLLVLYYTPMLKKPEEAPMGIGTLQIGEERVQVDFKPILSRRDKNGTEFSFLALPLGGFAAIKGMHPKEDGSETQIPGGFFSRPPWQRILVLFAGPLFSILAGVILLVGIFTTHGIDKAQNAPVFGAVGKDSVAEKAGIKQGDRIVSINGESIQTFYEAMSIIREHPGKEIRLVTQRKDKTQELLVTPKADTKPSPVLGADLEPTEEMKIQGKLGVLPSMKVVPVGLGEAVGYALRLPVAMASRLLGNFAKPSEFQNEVGGIASIAAATDQAARDGLVTVLQLAAMLSISLGIFNLLPVYPLDGGQMLVAFAEMFRGGRRLSMRVQNAVSTLGFALVCMLILFVLVVDARRFSGGKGLEKDPPAAAKSEK